MSAEAILVRDVRLTDAGMPPGPTGPALLDADGPRVVLGGADPIVGPVAPSATTMFGPRGAAILDDGALVVSDTGHHRVLVWHRAPTQDGAPADVVLGQPAFDREGRNALGDATAHTLNVPTGVGPWRDGAGLVVADCWNNRVLVWYERPRRSDVAADLVLGHDDFAGCMPNRGGEVGPNTLHWPTAALVVGERLIVCDVGNRRVLIWSSLPTRAGQPADVVLGQPDLRSRSDNGGGEPGPSSMRWPHDACVSAGDLVVTDAGNNRILVFDGIPDRDDADARWVLGQNDATAVDHNQGRYWPTAHTLNMPYAVVAHGDRLLCADTANSRLVGFARPFTDGAAAVALTGQPHFAAKGDNRWGPPLRDALCWPYGITIARGEHRDLAVVADTGNHRVCLWRIAGGHAP